jgi:hypothetical protein
MPQQEKVAMAASLFTVKNSFHSAALMGAAVEEAATLFWLLIQVLQPCLIFTTRHIEALALEDRDMAR